MGKRSSQSDTGLETYRKRQKLTQNVPAGEPITSSDQLQKLLSFDQDLQHARHALQSFKLLLDDVISESDNRHAGLAILKQYLEATKPEPIVDEEEEYGDNDDRDKAVFLADIMEWWSFASQTDNDGVMSSVAVVLALVLQAISASLDLVPHGLGICRTLLQERQLKSLSKNLSAGTSKGFVLSPTLRMLKEAVCLDGGAFARRIVRARHATFASLGRNMEIGLSENAAEDVRKTSVRTNAVRFFLSCLKYLHSDGRRELMSQRDLMSHLTFTIRGDPPYLILEILEYLKRYTLMDEKLPRDIKLRNFNTKTLTRVLGLYSYSVSSVEETESVVDAAHQFLLYICTTSSAGVLTPCNGLYPKATENDQLFVDPNNTMVAQYHDSVPVYNFVISEFIRKLKPWASLLQSKLLIAIFRAAPELITDYFHGTQSFTFEPKLSMTWVGYAAFLFDVMMLPLPAYFGDRSQYTKRPPPISILLDNIIPLPINQKVLVRCLSPKSNLTALFATRILVVAMEKLASATRMLQGQGASQNAARSGEAVQHLVDLFCQRVPDMKEVVRSYKSVPAENAVHRTMASRLIALYYEVVPQVAVAANFDVSPFFHEILRKDGNQDHKNDDAFVSLELENLPCGRALSQSSQQGCERGSSHTMRRLTESSATAPSWQLSRVLEEVAVENQLVSKKIGLSPFTRALRALIDQVSGEQTPRIWSLLDSSINRCGKSPLKYYAMLAELETPVNDAAEGFRTLLTIALIEQIPFAIKNATKEEIRALAKLLSLCFTALLLCGENRNVLSQLHSDVSKLLDNHQDFQELGAQSEVKLLHKFHQLPEEEDSQQPSLESQSLQIGQEDLREALHVPVIQNPDASVLTKWSAKSIDDLIDDDWIPRLVNLFSSPHPHIRQEAHTAILHLTARVKASSHEDKEQIWLLLSELTESTRSLIHAPSPNDTSASPVPSAFIAFTIHSLPIVLSPLHPLYDKVNEYVTHAPSWPSQKLPMAHLILHSRPSKEDKYYTELSYLLSYLLDALITPADLNTFHNKRWLEKIFALLGNPFLRQNLRLKVLRIVYRCTEIEGGCEVLIKRFGVLSWLDGLRKGDIEQDAVLEALIMRVWESCNKGEVQKWSNGGIHLLADEIMGDNNGISTKKNEHELEV